MDLSLENATQNGAGAIIEPSQPATPWPRTIWAWGTFDGATVTFEVSPDGVTWISLPDSAMTADAVMDIRISFFSIRAVISGAGASTDINAGMS